MFKSENLDGKYLTETSFWSNISRVAKFHGKIIDEIRSLLTKLIVEIYVYKFSQSNYPRRKCVSMASQCKHYIDYGEVSLHRGNSDRGFLASAGNYTLKLDRIGRREAREEGTLWTEGRRVGGSEGNSTTRVEQV